jgi:hypothetical protein
MVGRKHAGALPFLAGDDYSDAAPRSTELKARAFRIDPYVNTRYYQPSMNKRKRVAWEKHRKARKKAAAKKKAEKTTGASSGGGRRGAAAAAAAAPAAEASSAADAS